MDAVLMALGAAAGLAGVYLGAWAYSRGNADRGVGYIPRPPEPGAIFSPTREKEIAEQQERRMPGLEDIAD